MKSLIILIASLVIVTQAKASTLTVFSNTPINSSKYTNTVILSGKYRMYTAGKKGVNLRIKNSPLLSRSNYDLVVAFDGLDLIEMISRDPVKADNDIMLEAHCYGPYRVTYFTGTDYALFGEVCQIYSLTVTSPDIAPAPVYAAPVQEIPSLPTYPGNVYAPPIQYPQPSPAQPSAPAPQPGGGGRWGGNALQ